MNHQGKPKGAPIQDLHHHLSTQLISFKIIILNSLEPYLILYLQLVENKIILLLLFFSQKIPMGVQSIIHARTHHLHIMLSFMQSKNKHLNLQLLVLIIPLLLFIILSQRNITGERSCSEMRGRGGKWSKLKKIHSLLIEVRCLRKIVS